MSTGGSAPSGGSPRSAASREAERSPRGTGRDSTGCELPGEGGGKRFDESKRAKSVRDLTVARRRAALVDDGSGALEAARAVYCRCVRGVWVVLRGQALARLRRPGAVPG